MIKYIEATKRPYGYLFIDLKQSTPEEDRIKTDIFENIPGRESVHCKLTLWNSIKNTSMVGGGMDEYINRYTPKYGQFEYRSFCGLYVFDHEFLRVTGMSLSGK
jgi:hypothetical protein